MEIRFIHADHLRLAASIRGLADAPGWLKSLAAGAFRQATRNVVEQALAKRARFVVLAGSVTDSNADLDAVIRWLSEQFGRLRQAGIPVIAWATDDQHQAALSRICHQVLLPDQRLHVTAESPAADAELRFEVRPAAEVCGADLTVSVDTAPAAVPRHSPVLHYRIQPSEVFLHANRLMAGNGCLTASAGAVQASGPDEPYACGCLLVKADVAARSLSAQFVATDVLRFRQQSLSLQHPASAAHVRQRLQAALRDIVVDNERTLVVDWNLLAAGDAAVTAAMIPEASQHATSAETESASDERTIREYSENWLLQFIRHELQSGHRGIWPRTVRYAESTVSVEPAILTLAMREFVSLNSPVNSAAMSGRHPRVSAEALTGLEFLSRAA